MNPIVYYVFLLTPSLLFAYDTSWHQTTEQLLKKFSSVSLLNYSYIIEKNVSFNSSSYTDHKDGPAKIVIFSGLLQELEKEIPTILATNEICHSKTECMEVLLAPVIAHELAHYFQNDISNTKQIARMNDKLKAKERLKKMELHADLYAVELMVRAGLSHDNSLMVFFLKLASNWQKENQHNKEDPYTSSHPSLNQRLVVLGEDNFRLPYQLDSAFSTIRNSHNTNLIASACKSLDLALVRFPDNTELKRNLAICYHKLWLSTATESCIRFPHFIDSPIFSDDPEFIAKKTEGCGDVNFYITAHKHYESVRKLLTYDKKLEENHEMLLLYDNQLELSLKKISNASIFKKVNKRAESILTKDSIVNYGVVQYFRGNTGIAKLIFQKKAGNILNLSSTTEHSLKTLNLVSSNNQDENSINCVSAINYVLLLIYQKDFINNAVIKQYIHSIKPCSSQWANYAEQLVFTNALDF